MSYALYVTHPEVHVDPAVPVTEWRLSDAGRARAVLFARHKLASHLGKIVSSPETKARELADILAATSELPVNIVDNSGENDRLSTGYLPPERFEALADRFFDEPDVSADGWETARAAQARIVAAIGAVLDTHNPLQPIALAGHGAVGTLLKCALAGRTISRAEDQSSRGHPGGGSVLVIRLSDRALLTDWTPMEALPAAIAGL